MKLVIIGAQWGDEGKGKIVDFLAEQASLVIRYSGGANAGHTIVHGGVTYKLHLIPSGIIYPGKNVLLGNGMVIDPEAFFSELETIAGQGISYTGRVFISERAHIVLPRYKEEDKEIERNRKYPIGTTGRGIGIAFAHKAYRDGIRVCDLWCDSIMHSQSEEDRRYLESYKEKLKPFVIDPLELIDRNESGNILFEGAQGTLLDLDNGTYPFVSSGYSAAAGACLGSSLGPREIDKVLGVF